jgi:hypothetical protein
MAKSAVKHQVADKSEPKQSYGHNGNEAAGLWYLNDLFINLDQQTLRSGSAIYEDHSVKTQGEWRILRTGYKRFAGDDRPAAQSMADHLSARQLTPNSFFLKINSLPAQ